jgi:hypothetical protein
MGKLSNMARINIDDSIYKHRGFAALISHYTRSTDLPDTICVRLAKGCLWELFTLAQEYWYPKRRAIPKQVFDDAEFPAILYGRGGLCTLEEDGIHVHGAEEAFKWLFQKKAAGEASGKARASKPKRERKRTDVEQALNGTQRVSTESNLLSPTLSSSFFSLSSGSSLNSHISDKKAPKSKTASAQSEGPSAVTLTWEAYKAAYAKRHGAEPPKNARIMGQLKHFVARVPAAEAPAIAEFYLSHYGQRYVTAKHPVGMLLLDAEKIRTEWLTGNISTNASARSAERDQHNKQVITEFLREKDEQRQERQV